MFISPFRLKIHLYSFLFFYFMKWFPIDQSHLNLAQLLYMHPILCSLISNFQDCQFSFPTKDSSQTENPRTISLSLTIPYHFTNILGWSFSSHSLSHIQPAFFSIGVITSPNGFKFTSIKTDVCAPSSFPKNVMLEIVFVQSNPVCIVSFCIFHHLIVVDRSSSYRHPSSLVWLLVKGQTVNCYHRSKCRVWWRETGEPPNLWLHSFLSGSPQF